MNSTTLDAFNRGFVKTAMANGLDILTAVELLKVAIDPQILSALAGGGIGAGVGALAAGPDNRGKGALYGAVGGAGLGLGANALYNHLKSPPPIIDAKTDQKALSDLINGNSPVDQIGNGLAANERTRNAHQALLKAIRDKNIGAHAHADASTLGAIGKKYLMEVPAEAYKGWDSLSSGAADGIRSGYDATVGKAVGGAYDYLNPQPDIQGAK